MSTYKEAVNNKNNERKTVYSQLLTAIEQKDEKVVDKLVLKMGIYASKPDQVGFSIHDLRTFLNLTEKAIEKYSLKANYQSEKLRKINNHIAKQNGINVKRSDIIARKDEFFWLSVYKKKLNARLRMENILIEQLGKRHVHVLQPVYRDTETVKA